MSRMPKRGTQMRTALDLLMERGSTGVSVHEMIYEHGITRMAAIVERLRKDGYQIRTIDNGEGMLASYVLERAPASGRNPARNALCVCSHPLSGHSVGMQCMGYTEFVYCRCQRFKEAA